MYEKVNGKIAHICLPTIEMPHIMNYPLQNQGFINSYRSLKAHASGHLKKITDHSLPLSIEKQPSFLYIGAASIILSSSVKNHKMHG